MSKLQQFLERDSLSDLIPVRACDPRTKIFYTEDGDARYLGTVLFFAPTPGASEDIAEKLNTLLRSDYPTGTMLQVMLLASPDVSHQLADILDLRTDATAPLLRRAKQSEVEFYARGVSEPIERQTKTRVRDFQVIVTLKMPVSDIPGDDDLARIGEYQSQLLTGFETIAGMRGVALDAEQYLYVMKTILDWTPDAAWRTEPQLLDPDRVINEQIWEPNSQVRLDSDHEKGFWIGEKRVMVLSPKRLPKHYSLSLASALISDARTSQRGLRGNFAVCLNIYYPDQLSSRDSQSTKRAWVNRQAYGPMLRMMPRLGEYKNSYDCLFAGVDSGDRLVQICPTWILFGDSRKETEAAADNAKQYLVELGYQLAVDEFVAFPMFVNALPLCADAAVVNFSKRYHTVGTSHAVHFLPIGGDWRGTKTPTMTLVSRNGQLMNVDLFDSSTNFNSIIAAASGSGKSFLTNYKVASYLSTGAQVWIIDVGGSYKKLCESLDGQYLQFGPKSRACLNPFQLVEDYNDESDVIIGLLQAMMSPPEASDLGLTAYQIAGLKEHTKRLWDDHGKGLTLDQVARALRADSDQRITDLGQRLFAFTSGGEYGGYFNGVNNVEFDRQFFVLELEELKGRPHLQQVVLLMLLYQIQQAVYLAPDRSQHKLVEIDEAWDLLKSPSVAAFMEGAYRRFRKYGASITLITQGLDDLATSVSGKAMLANSANIMLLGQSPAKVALMEKEGLLKLSAGGFRLLETVASVKGHYSEIFCYLDNGAQAGIGRLIVDRRTQLLYTTDPKEVAALDGHRARGLGLMDAIDAVVLAEAA